MSGNNEEKYKEGYGAYWDGIQQENCPYPVGTIYYTSWVDGWFDALTDDGYCTCDDPQFL